MASTDRLEKGLTFKEKNIRHQSRFEKKQEQELNHNHDYFCTPTY